MHRGGGIWQLCAVLANINRGRDSKPFGPEDFFPALAREFGKSKSSEPILLDDPEAQSALIKKFLTGGA